MISIRLLSLKVCIYIFEIRYLRKWSIYFADAVVASVGD